MLYDPRLHRVLDAQLPLTRWPAREAQRLAALQHLAARIEPTRTYTEREISALLSRWHTFGDAALLRRELFERGFVGRSPDGAAYWRERLDVVRFY